MSKRRRIDPEMAKLSEKVWQDRIDHRARALGALTNHVYPAKMIGGKFITTTSHAGFPDLWCLFPTGRLCVFECKREDAPPSAVKAAQRQWIAWLQRNPGIDAYVVRPSDWGHVERILERAAQPSAERTKLSGLTITNDNPGERDGCAGRL